MELRHTEMKLRDSCSAKKGRVSGELPTVAFLYTCTGNNCTRVCIYEQEKLENSNEKQKNMYSAKMLATRSVAHI